MRVCYLLIQIVRIEKGLVYVVVVVRHTMNLAIRYYFRANGKSKKLNEMILINHNFFSYFLLQNLFEKNLLERLNKPVKENKKNVTDSRMLRLL